MPTTTTNLDLSYPAIKDFFGRHLVKSRTESAALLAWFLDNYYHLESTEVADSICDKKFDKGIDGIYVNDLVQQIDVISCVIGTATPVQGLGDTDLKDLMGTLTQFSSGDSVRTLAKSVEKKLPRRFQDGAGARYSRKWARAARLFSHRVSWSSGKSRWAIARSETMRR